MEVSMDKKIADFAKNYGNAFIVGVFLKKNILFTNLTAENLFGIHCDSSDLDMLFSRCDKSLLEMISGGLSTQDLVIYNNIPVLSKTGEILYCDLQLGFFNPEKTEYFLEITPKPDNRMEMAMHQVELSTRAEGILLFDEKLTLLHGNSHFFDVFEASEETRHSHFSNYFSNGFQPDIREELLGEIHQKLKESTHFLTEMKVITSSGKEIWYSLELQRRTLDFSGVDKIMAYLVNIERYVKIESDFKSINQYFCAIQELSDDLLYRIDIKNATLIRREKTENQANLFGMNIVARNFPESVCESGVIHEDDIPTYLEFGHKALKGIPSTAEVRMKSKSGEFGFRRIICVPVTDDRGIVQEMLGKVVNIQGVRELEEKANHDALTNALNKRAMLEVTSHLLEQSTKSDCHGLLFLDLDDFKYVNDNLGHSFGDHLLHVLGIRLHENTLSGDLVGRVGGDEFVILLRNIPSADMLKGKSERLLRTISELIVDGDKSHSIGGSIGIAIYPDHGATYEELYEKADRSLYRSKEKGKNTVTIYTPEDDGFQKD